MLMTLSFLLHAAPSDHASGVQVRYVGSAIGEDGSTLHSLQIGAADAPPQHMRQLRVAFREVLAADRALVRVGASVVDGAAVCLRCAGLGTRGRRAARRCLDVEHASDSP